MATHVLVLVPWMYVFEVVVCVGGWMRRVGTPIERARARQRAVMDREGNEAGTAFTPVMDSKARCRKTNNKQITMLNGHHLDSNIHLK
jgi:hypothetical protein